MASGCSVNQNDPNLAFLNYIVDTSTNSAEARESIDSSCHEIDLLGDNTDEFGQSSAPEMQNDDFKSFIQNKLPSYMQWGTILYADLMSAEAEYPWTVSEMKKKHPEFIAKLDSFKNETNVWTRLRNVYQYVTEISSYDQDLLAKLMAGTVRGSSSNPVASVGRALQKQPIGVCGHYAALLDFSLTYVGGGPKVHDFDVMVNIGNQHAWNHVVFTGNRTGHKYDFDLDATHFEKFIPLSVSHFATISKQIRAKILDSCRKVKSCLN